MAWTSLASILLRPDWQYTDPVSGTFFRLKHTGAPYGGLFAIGQAEFNTDNSINLIDVQFLETGQVQEYDVLRLPKPNCFGDRRIAIRRIISNPSLESELRRLLNVNLFKSSPAARSPSVSTWTTSIEVSDSN